MAVDLSSLIAQLEAVVADPSAAGPDRLRILSLARAAAVAVEEPFETVQRLAYSPLPLITARIGQQHGIFAALAKGPVSFNDLLATTGLAPGVLESVMDYLCSQGMADEKDGVYTATKLSHMMMVPLFQDAVTHFHDNCLPAFGALNHTVKEGVNAFKAGQHSDQDFYTWLETHPVQQGAFHRFMEAQFASLPTWLDVVDFSDFSKGLTPSDAAFVDVGGGNGQQCDALLKKFPDLRGRVVLQDTPNVLGKALQVERMEKMSYDYLTEQPVKAARVYYFRQIMHNNDDETCIRILKAQIPAMDKNSVIVIDDKTLPDEKPPPGTAGVEYTAGLGLAMKAMFDAQERRAAHWKELIAKTGLVMRDVRVFTKFADSAIILEKA